MPFQNVNRSVGFLITFARKVLDQLLGCESNENEFTKSSKKREGPIGRQNPL